jgi:hypothetical protein
MNTARGTRAARPAHWRSALIATAASACAVLTTAKAAEARVTRFVAEERVPFAPGTEWGTAVSYERLKGTAHMEVDPADPLNPVIVNLDRAPRKPRGMVEFSAPFFIRRPEQPSRAPEAAIDPAPWSALLVWGF